MKKYVVVLLVVLITKYIVFEKLSSVSDRKLLMRSSASPGME